MSLKMYYVMSHKAWNYKRALKREFVAGIILIGASKCQDTKIHKLKASVNLRLPVTFNLELPKIDSPLNQIFLFGSTLKICSQSHEGNLCMSTIVKQLLRTLVVSTVVYLENWFHQYASVALCSICKNHAETNAGCGCAGNEVAVRTLCAAEVACLSSFQKPIAAVVNNLPLD